nr:MAG TPA: hypothetical protein [Caudoviricetes sp.]
MLRILLPFSFSPLSCYAITQIRSFAYFNTTTLLYVCQ